MNLVICICHGPPLPARSSRPSRKDRRVKLCRYLCPREGDVGERKNRGLTSAACHVIGRAGDVSPLIPTHARCAGCQQVEC